MLVLHVLLACLAPVLTSRLGRRAFWIFAIPPVLTFGYALWLTPQALSDTPPMQTLAWVPSIGLELAFRMDALAWLLCLIVGGVGALVLAYCSAYFSDDEPNLGRFAGCLLGFAGAMLGLVTSDDLLMLYLFWEATTVLSYLLIGHRPESRASRSAATEALVVTTFGGLAMLVGLIIIGENYGTYRLSEVIATAVAAPPVTDPVMVAAVALVLLGAMSKSALVPFHFWLPGAMAAPTPVSAYLHAAAMVKAGIYLVARFAPAYADVPLWKILVLVLGGSTMVLGAYRSLRQNDLKLLLAYGTVSQLGFLVILVGAGTGAAALAGVAMVLAHALYKACLFLVVGAIDHATGTRDLRELSGLGRSARGLAIAGVVGAASMAGLPPLLGFVGKEAAYGAFTDFDEPWDVWVLAVLVIGSILTFAYSVRFVWGAFRTQPDREPTPVHAPGPVLTGVPLTLAALSLLAGPLAPFFEPGLRGWADTAGESVASSELTLWHGFNLALWLTLLTWACGIGLALIRTRVEELQADVNERLWHRLSAEGAYRKVMLHLDRGSLEVTAALQRGSLPLSLTLIFMVFLAFPGGFVLLSTDWSAALAGMRLSDGIPQVITAAIMAVCAIWAVRARRRMRAVFLVGATGYGCALLFLIFGSPDLALTQVLVETLSIIVFVLVLRRFPSRFTADRPRWDRMTRAGFGLAVGAVAAALALAMPHARSFPAASVGMGPEAVEYGGGQNIVNIILVDIRAWDTMGELSVVLAAATGIASLVFLHEDRFAMVRRRLADSRARRRESTRRGVSYGRWLAEDNRIRPEQRSVMFEVVARLTFHVVMLWSVFLLFAGHNDPGGGFAAGIVAGLALTLRYLAGGREELRAAIPVLPGLLLGIGLFLSAGNGLASMIAGGDVLQTWIYDIPMPLIGELHIVTSLVFDVGVYLVVIGLVLDILRSLGGAIDQQIDDARAPRAARLARATSGGAGTPTSGPASDGLPPAQNGGRDPEQHHEQRQGPGEGR
nr:Na+/H+ antiporter subunit A [Kineosphaera limosa]